MDLDDIIATGELFKQGRGRKSWNLRKFVLSGAYLSYYDKENNKKGEIDLTGCSLQRKTAEECQMPPAKHAFAIIGVQKFLLVSASNEENRILWMELIQKQIDEYKDEARKFIQRGELIMASGFVKKVGMIGWMSTSVKLVLTNLPRLLVLDPAFTQVKECVNFTREQPIKFEKVDSVKFKLIDKKREAKYISESIEQLAYWEIAFANISNAPIFRKLKGKSFSIGKTRIDILEGDILSSINTGSDEAACELERGFDTRTQTKLVSFATNTASDEPDAAEDEEEGEEEVEEDEDEEAGEYEDGEGEENGEHDELEDYYDDEENISAELEADEDEEYSEDQAASYYEAEYDEYADEFEFETVTVTDAIIEANQHFKDLMTHVTEAERALHAKIQLAIETGDCEMALVQSAEVRLAQDSMRKLENYVALLCTMLDKLLGRFEVASDSELDVDVVSTLLVQSREFHRHHDALVNLTCSPSISNGSEANTVVLKRESVQLRIAVDSIYVEIMSIHRMVSDSITVVSVSKASGDNANSNPNHGKLSSSSVSKMFGAFTEETDGDGKTALNTLPPQPKEQRNEDEDDEEADLIAPLPAPGAGRVKQATRRYTAIANKLAQSALEAHGPSSNAKKQSVKLHAQARMLLGHEEFNGSLVFEKAKGIAKCSVGGIVLDLLPAKFDPSDPTKRPAGWHRVRLYKVQALERQDRSRGVSEEEIESLRLQREQEVERQMLIDCEPFRSHVAKFIVPSASQQQTPSGKAIPISEAVRRASRRGSLEKLVTMDLAKSHVRRLEARPSKAVFPVGFQAQFQRAVGMGALKECEEDEG